MRSRWPSVGFVFVTVVYGAVAGFFVWGLGEPELDRVWALRHELRSGRLSKLSANDCELLQRTLARHARLAEWLLNGAAVGLVSSHQDGWLTVPGATIVRAAGVRALRVVHFDVQTPADLLPLRIAVWGDDWRQTVSVERPGPVDLALPEAPDHPEVFQVEIQGRKPLLDASMLGVRITFPGA